MYKLVYAYGLFFWVAYPIYLAISYYRHDKHVVISYEENTGAIIFKDQSKTVEFQLSEIEAIRMYYSRYLLYYYSVSIKGHGEVAVSCLTPMNDIIAYAKESDRYYREWSTFADINT